MEKHEAEPVIEIYKREFNLADVKENNLRPISRPKVLTEQIIRDAKPHGVERSIADGTVSCLYLRVRKSGHKSFVYYYRYRGRLRKIRIAAASDITLERARDIAREFRAVLAGGEDPSVSGFGAVGHRVRRRERRRYKKDIERQRLLSKKREAEREEARKAFEQALADGVIVI